MPNLFGYSMTDDKEFRNWLLKDDSSGRRFTQSIVASLSPIYNKWIQFEDYLVLVGGAAYDDLYRAYIGGQRVEFGGFTFGICEVDVLGNTYIGFIAADYVDQSIGKSRVTVKIL